MTVERHQLPQHDVFLCHASEDKETVVRPLYEALSDSNLRVWFDEAELVLGDSIVQLINHGISTSKVAVVVVSNVFLKKQWPQAELDAFQNLYITTRKRILIVRHAVTHEQFAGIFPLLGHILTTDFEKSVPTIREEIIRALKKTWRDNKPVYKLRFRSEVLIDRVGLAELLSESEGECRLDIEWPNYFGVLLDDVADCLKLHREGSSQVRGGSENLRANVFIDLKELVELGQRILREAPSRLLEIAKRLKAFGRPFPPHMDALAGFLEILNLETSIRFAEAIYYMRGKHSSEFPIDINSLKGSNTIEKVILKLGHAIAPLGSARVQSVANSEDLWLCIFANLDCTRRAYQDAKEFGGSHTDWFWRNLVPQAEHSFFRDSVNKELVYNEKCIIDKTYNEDGWEEYPYNPPTITNDEQGHEEYADDDSPF